MSAPPWLQRGVFRALTDVVFPACVALALPLLWLRRKRRRTLPGRLGLAGWPRPGAAGERPVWIHALSVGEVLSAERLVAAVCEAGTHRVVLSVATLGGHEIAAARLGDRVDRIFYFPFDVSWIAGRAIDAVRPALFVLVETDVWPHFMAAIRRRGVPALLVNGRISAGTLRSYTRWPGLFVPMLRTFRWIYPQSDGEARRFREAGVEAAVIRRCGNLKFDVAGAAPGPAAAEPRDRLGLAAGAPVIVAGSTHPGEEALVREAFLAARESFPGLALVLAPREPERAREVLALFDRDDLRAVAYSAAGDGPAEVVVIDRIGVLRALYALADVAFVGGSLVAGGGHNPIEPAAHGRPVLFGPDMEDFPDVSQWLLEAGGGFRVEDAAALGARCRDLLGDPGAARRAGDAARAVVDRHRGTTQAIAADIASILGAGASSGGHTQ